MEKYEIQKLRDLPIEGVAERLGLKVVRHKALCPFHADKHPSLTFNVRKNNCRCYVCMNESLGTIDLAMKYLHKDFKNACEWLSLSPFRTPSIPRTAGAEILPEVGRVTKSTNTENQLPPISGGLRGASWYARFFKHPYLSPEAQHFLYDERHLDPRVVRWCRLNSYTDKHGIPWLQIPYYDRDGKLIGVQSRNLRPSKSPCLGGLPTSSVPRTQVPIDEGGSPIGGNTKGLPIDEECSPTGGIQRGPRFRFPTGSHCTIYNLPVLKMLRPGEDLYIAEGCSDCWSLLSAGHKAIAIPSATLLNPNELLRELNTLPKQDFCPCSTSCEPQGGTPPPFEDFCPRCSGDRGGAAGMGRVCMFPDQDAPGERLFLQLRDVLSKSGLTLVRHQLPPGCKDFSDYYCKQRQ